MNTKTDSGICIRQNVACESRIADLEDQLQRDADMYKDQLTQKDVEVRDLRMALNDLSQEFADMKLRLDKGREAIRKVLDEEEERLAISYDLGSPNEVKGTKRKRVTIDESFQPSSFEFESTHTSKGAVEIHDTDHHGKFIKLFNTGDDDIVMRGWILKHTAGDKEFTYKFHNRQVLKAGQFLTVWSSNAGQTHSPPTDLVMKGQQWPIADEMKSVLYHDDEEMATRELNKTTRSVTRYSRSLTGEDDVDGKKNVACESRIADLEDQLQRDADMYRDQLTQKDIEVRDLRMALNDQSQEFADMKLRLDKGREAMRKVLDEEEERLDISYDLGSPNEVKGTKRKYVTTDESFQPSSFEFESTNASKGAVEIQDTDHHGTFIKLFNTGDDDIVIGGWILKDTAGDKESTYKFHNRQVLKAGQFLKVWSPKSGQKHDPPTDLVMKGQQWHIADEMKSVLYHNDEEMATLEMKKTMRSFTDKDCGQ